VAVVTGAGRGIGRATAIRLASEGASVVVGDLDGDPLASLVSELPIGRAFSYLGDTADPDQADALIQTAVDHFGTVDVVVNNAGTTRDRMFHRQTRGDLDDVLDANLRTAWNATQSALTVMRPAAKAELAADGQVDHIRKIVFTSSVAALTGGAGQANYTAAKGAIISLVKSLALELGSLGITVNAVAPGFIETRLTAVKADGQDVGIPHDIRESIRGMISLGRFGLPEDVAAATAFLASADSDYVSGVTLPVTGGQFGGMG
jgi:3-oxoacyl-[acyl-carrier protein] reductase